MGNLIQKLAGVLSAAGLAACVSGGDIDEKAENAPRLEVPASIGYDAVDKWDKAYFTAILGINDPEILLARLTFESYLEGKDGIIVARALTSDEIDGLNIRTRQDLADFLKGRAKYSRGYVGPNLLQ
jgi:hypothetical protein